MRKKPDYDPLRPIGARALKSALDTLRPYLAGARVLDLYAGQGRFGEATLEEDAASVLFVEKDPRTAAELRRNLKKFGERTRIVTADVFAFLQGDRESYDLVFADPPFPDWQSDFQTRLFSAAAPHLIADGIFLVKHPSRVLLSDCASGFSPWKSVAFGESTLAYFRYAPEEKSKTSSS